MPGDHTHAFDAASPIDAGYMSPDFGLLFPSDNGTKIWKTTHGVSCHQISIFGHLLPFGNPRLNRGTPDWHTRADGGVPKDEKHPIADVDLNTIPEEDFETLPEWVKEREPVQFYNYQEFSDWLGQNGADDAWWYGWTDLIKELKWWNYDATGDMPHSRDMTRVWDSVDEIWGTIDDSLSFTYEEFDYDARREEVLFGDAEEPDPIISNDELPGNCEGIRWVTITGSKTKENGDYRSPWAEELAGEPAALLYPNSD